MAAAAAAAATVTRCDTEEKSPSPRRCRVVGGRGDRLAIGGRRALRLAGLASDPAVQTGLAVEPVLKGLGL